MVLIGITGSFGSGKTTVAKLFKKQCGKTCEIIDADKIAKKLMRNQLKKKIKTEFGTTNRKELADIVFSDKRKLNKLNSIVHPYVRIEIKKRIQNSEKNFILDTPLLIEAGKTKVDYLVIVNCDKKKQLSRLMIKGHKKEDILRRLRHQLTFDKKLKKAKKITNEEIFIINNSGKLEKTRDSVKKIIHSLSERSE
ncbi:dephospho-CoA kinase [Candidatus Aenigmatarchaeota archaeon]